MRDAARALLREHWRAGGELWLPACGGSMQPYLGAGDLLLVRGLRPGELPAPGRIAVLSRHGELVAHFVIRVEGGVVYTRGARRDGDVEETPLAEVCGVVVGARRRWRSAVAWLASAALRSLARVSGYGRGTGPSGPPGAR